MKVETLITWNDLKEGVTHNPGDVVEMTDERFAEVTAYRDDLVKAIEETEAEEPEEQESEAPEPEKAPARKRKTK